MADNINNKTAVKSDTEPQTTKIVCTNLTYDYTNTDLYSEVKDKAIEKVQREFEDNRRDEEDEIQDMLDDGEITSADEYDRLYNKPFNPHDYEERISQLSNEYFRNVADLPRDMVVDIDKVLIDKRDNMYDAMVAKYITPIQKKNYGSTERAKQRKQDDIDRAYKEMENSPEQKALAEYEGELAEILIDEMSRRYNVPVTDMQNFDKATSKDIGKQKSFEAIAKMYQSDDFRTYVALTDNMKGYSVTNTALVIAQLPDAEAVKGFYSWRKPEFERSVAKGEHGATISCPVFKKLHNEKEVISYLGSHGDQYGRKGTPSYDNEKQRLLGIISQKGEVDVLSYYKFETVFDIKQTVPLEGTEDRIDELLGALRFDKPLGKSMDNYITVVKCIETAAGLPQGTINIKSSVSEQDNIYKALEAHAEDVLSNHPESIVGIKSFEPLTGDIHKLEVMLSASLTAQHLGIQCDDKTAYAMSGVMKDKFSEQSLTIGRREMFTTAYSRAIKFANAFNKEFDKAFEPYKAQLKSDQEQKPKKEKKQVERD